MNENMKDMVEIEETCENKEEQKPECGIDDIKEVSGEKKMFSQEKLEEILKERLQRERKQTESLTAVKNLLKEISRLGIIKANSYSEMSKQLIELLNNGKAQQDEAFAQSETSFVAEKDGDTAIDTAGQADGNEKNEGEQNFFAVLSNIRNKYSDSAVEKLLSGDLFEKFAKGRNGRIEDIFDDYYGFMSMIDTKKEAEKTDEDGNSDFASTSFSSYSGVSDSGTNLTKQQMEIAKSAGMSYREYANLLDSVPKKTGRTF